MKVPAISMASMTTEDKSTVGSGQSSTNGGKQLWSVESDGVDSIQLLEGGNQDCSSLHNTGHRQHVHR